MGLSRMLDRRLRAVVAAILAVVLGWGSATLYVPRTPVGTHCPTASVQTVAVQTVTVHSKTCCGKTISKQVRKPKVGEAGFKQCRCAETRSATAHADFGGAPGFPVAYVPASFSFAIPPRPLEARCLSAFAVPPVELKSEPTVPPPDPA